MAGETILNETIKVKIGANFDFSGIKAEQIPKGIAHALKGAAAAGEISVPIKVSSRFNYVTNQIDQTKLTGGVPKPIHYSPEMVVSPNVKYVAPTDLEKGLRGVISAGKIPPAEMAALSKYADVLQKMGGIDLGGKFKSNEWELYRKSVAGTAADFSKLDKSQQGIVKSINTFQKGNLDTLKKFNSELSSLKPAIPENYVVQHEKAVARLTRASTLYKKAALGFEQGKVTDHVRQRSLLFLKSSEIREGDARYAKQTAEKTVYGVNNLDLSGYIQEQSKGVTKLNRISSETAQQAVVTKAVKAADVVVKQKEMGVAKAIIAEDKKKVSGRNFQKAHDVKRADEERNRLVKLGELRDEAIQWKGKEDLKVTAAREREIERLNNQQELYERRKELQGIKAGQSLNTAGQAQADTKDRKSILRGRAFQKAHDVKRADEERQRLIKIDKLREDAIRFKGLNDLKEVEKIQKEIAGLHQQQEAYQRRKDFQSNKAGQNRQESLETREAEKERALTFAGRKHQATLIQKGADEERQRLIKIDKLREDAIRFKGLNDLKEVEKIQKEIAGLHQQQEAYQRRKDFQSDRAAQRLQDTHEVSERQKLFNEHQRSIKRGADLDSQGTPFTRTMPHTERIDLGNYHRDGRRQGEDLQVKNQLGTQGHTDGINMVNHHTAALNRLSESAKRATGFVASMQRAFTTLTEYGIAGSIVYRIADAFRAVVTSVIELEDEMKNIQAITSSSDTQMAVIGQSIKDTATTTAFSIKEIAGAVKTVAQAGVEMKDIPKTVQAIADVATATGSQLQTAADIITTVKEVWDNIDVSTIGDRVAQAANISKLAVEDLKTILSLNAAAAKSSNVSLEQSLSLDALLRNSGVKASTIATGSTQMYRELFSPDKKFSDFLAKQYGKIGETTTSEEAAKRFSDYRNSDNPLVEAISELKRIGVGDHKSIAELERSMDSRALNVFKPLLNSKESLQGLEAQMRAGATASEGAATASHTVKKAFENLGDQVEVLADAMGQPLLEPIQNLVNWINKNVVKPAAEEMDLANTYAKSNRRETERQFQKGNYATGIFNEIGGIAAGAIGLGADTIGGSSDIPLKNLLAQQATKQREREKEFEQYKAFSDAPDSLKTTFDKKKSEYNNFNSNLLDVFGKEAKLQDMESIISLLAEASGKKEDQRKNIVGTIQTKLGSTKTVDVEEVSRIANEAAGIKESLAAMTKAYKATFISLVETGETVGRSIPQETLFKKLKEIKDNPEYGGAAFGNANLSMAGSIKLNDDIASVMAPGVAEAKKKLAEGISKDISEQAASAILNPSKDGSEKDLMVAMGNLDEKLKDGTVSEAVKINADILKAIQDSPNLGAEQKAVIEAALKDTMSGAVAKIAKSFEEATAIFVDQLDQGIKAFESIPAEERTKTDDRYLAGLKETKAKREGSTGKFSQDAFNQLAIENGINPEFANKIWDRESRSSGDSATSSAGAQGRMQMMPATFGSMQKMFGLKGDISDPAANSEAAMKYLVYLSTKKGEVIPGALNGRISTNNFTTEAEVGGAYNVGEGNFRAYQKGKRGLPDETENYMKGLGSTSPKLFELGHKKEILAGQTEKGVADPENAKAIAASYSVQAARDEALRKDYDARDSEYVSSVKDQILDQRNEFTKNDGNAAKQRVNQKNITDLNKFLVGDKEDWLSKQVEGKVYEGKPDKAAKQRYKIAQENRDIVSEDTKVNKGLDDKFKFKSFNENDPEVVALTEQLRIIKEKQADLEPGGLKNSAELLKLNGAGLAVDTKLSGLKTKFFQNEREYTADELNPKNNVQATDLRKVKEDLDAKVKASKKYAQKYITDGVLKAADAVVKSLEKELDANTFAVGEAQTLGDESLVKQLQAKRVEIDAKLLAAKKDKNNKDPNALETANFDLDQQAKLDNRKREAEAVDSRIGTRESNLQVKIGDPIEGYARKGRQEALGHTQYIQDQKAQNARDIEAQQARLTTATADFNSATNKVDAKKFQDEIDKTTQELAKLKVTSEDLSATFSSELDQISSANIGAEINNLQGSLKNLDKNLTQRIVQGVDQFSTDVADSTTKAVKGLLGFNVATQAAKDAMLNLMDKKGNAAIVGTNRAQLAMEVQSIRMNESDPVRQEMLIKQAMDSQKQAEDIAAFQVEEAQKASDKVKFDESFAGKFQKNATDMVTGAATDVIKGEVLGVFQDALGLGKNDGSSADKALWTKDANNPLAGAVKNATGSTTSGGIPSVSPGFLSTIGTAVGGAYDWASSKTSQAYDYLTANTDPTQGIVSQGIEDTSGYGATPNLTPIGDQSAASGANVLPGAVAGATSTGVEDGFNKVIEPTKGIFSDFTSKLEGANGVFLAGLSAMFAMNAASGSGKMSTFQKVQMGIGMLGSLASLGSSVSGMMKAPSGPAPAGFTGPPAPHATGGYITGPGTATSDSIPTMLSNGEYVIKADAVRHIGKDTLDNWNAITKAPVYRATGGIVGSLKPAPMQQAQVQTASASAQPQSIRVVMVDDQRDVGNFISSPGGEKTLVDFVRRNSMSIKQILK